MSATQERRDEGVISIGIVGNTGSGKSSFINAILGENKAPVKDGTDSYSRTDKVEGYEYTLSSGLHVVLVDTPSFNCLFPPESKTPTSLEILKQTHKIQQGKFSHILIIQSVTCKTEVQAVKGDESRILKKLCPDWGNIFVVTTHWDEESIDLTNEEAVADAERNLSRSNCFLRWIEGKDGDTIFYRSGNQTKPPVTGYITPRNLIHKLFDDAQPEPISENVIPTDSNPAVALPPDVESNSDNLVKVCNRLEEIASDFSNYQDVFADLKRHYSQAEEVKKERDEAIRELDGLRAENCDLKKLVHDNQREIAWLKAEEVNEREARRLDFEKHIDELQKAKRREFELEEQLRATRRELDFVTQQWGRVPPSAGQGYSAYHPHSTPSRYSGSVNFHQPPSFPNPPDVHTPSRVDSREPATPAWAAQSSEPTPSHYSQPSVPSKSKNPFSGLFHYKSRPTHRPPAPPPLGKKLISGEKEQTDEEDVSKSEFEGATQAQNVPRVLVDTSTRATVDVGPGASPSRYHDPRELSPPVAQAEQEYVPEHGSGVTPLSPPPRSQLAANRTPEPGSDSESEDGETGDESEDPPSPLSLSPQLALAVALDVPPIAPARLPGGVGFTAIVLRNYDATEGDEIDIREGECIIEIDGEYSELGGWLRGKNPAGKIGFFPGTHVEIQARGSQGK